MQKSHERQLLLDVVVARLQVVGFLVVQVRRPHVAHLDEHLGALHVALHLLRSQVESAREQDGCRLVVHLVRFGHAAAVTAKGGGFRRTTQVFDVRKLLLPLGSHPVV